MLFPESLEQQFIERSNLNTVQCRPQKPLCFIECIKFGTISGRNNVDVVDRTPNVTGRIGIKCTRSKMSLVSLHWNWGPIHEKIQYMLS